MHSNIRRPFSNYNNQDNQNSIISRTFYNSNLIIYNPKIEFTIGLTTGQSNKFVGNPDENLKLVINKFLKQENLSYYENKVKAVLFNGSVLNLNKTLSENNIEKGSNILVVIQNEENKIVQSKKLKISLKDIILAKMILSDVLTDLGEFNELLLTSLQKSISKQNLLPSEMIKKNCDGLSECTHIHTYKHYHGLVFIIIF